MSQQPPPPADHVDPNVQAAYRQGYLDGHLSGWRDAMKAAAAQATTPVPAAGQQAAPPVPAPAQATTVPPTAQPFARPVVPAEQAVPARPTPPAAAAIPPAQAPHFPPTPPMVPPRTPLDPAAAAARKAKRETQNINITLYVASLLMVAAAALFVGSSLPETARLVGVWLGTAVFYTAGLVLHARVPRLKPAATAFVGTALAIIPFAGIATYSLGFPDAPGVWLLTSLIGTVAYVVAALRMNSRLIVYLSLAFLLSTAWSSTAVLGAALAWYFAALVVLSALLSIAAQALARRGRSSTFTALYARPLTELGIWFAPVGLAGSLVASIGLNAADHLIVLAAGVVHYALMLFVPVELPRKWSYAGLRASLTLAAPFIGWIVSEETSWTLAALTVVLALQLFPVAYMAPQLGVFLQSPRWPRLDLFISVPTLAVAGFLWSASLILEGSGQLVVWGVAAVLLSAMVLLPPILPAGEWLPAPAALAALCLSPFFGAWDWSVLLAIATAYGLWRFAAAPQGRIKNLALVAARFTATGFVAALLAALIPPFETKPSLIVATVAVIAALQLFIDTIMLREGGTRITVASAVAWATVGTAAVLTLSLAAQRADVWQISAPGQFHAVRWEFFIAALLLSGCAAFYSLSALSLGKKFSELLAPIYLGLAALAAGTVFDAGGASFAWFLTFGYFLLGGYALRKRQTSLHRWLYWWCARATSLLLAVALFQWWRETDLATTLFGAHISLGQAVVLALTIQLILLGTVVVRGHRPRGLDVDITITAFLAAFAAGLPAGETHPWTVLVAAGLLAAAVAVVMIFAGLPARGFRLAHIATPAALTIIALWHTSSHGALTLVTSIGVLAAAVVAWRGGSRKVRSAYFLLARAGATALAGIVTDAATDAPAATSLVLAAAVLAQLGVQLMLLRSERLTVAVGERTVLLVGGWLLIGTVVLIPLGYLAETDGFDRQGLRWVVLLHLLALLIAATMGQLLLGLRGAAFVGLPAVMGAAAVVEPLLWEGATALILLGLMLAMMVWRCLREAKAPELRWFWLTGVGAFLLAALMVEPDAAPGILGGLWLAAGLALILGAHLMRQRELTLPGAALVFVAALLFREQVLDLSARPGLSALAGLLVVMGVLYAIRLASSGLLEDSSIRRGHLVAVALAGGAVFALWSMADRGTIYLGAAAFMLVAGLGALEAPRRFRWQAVDAAILLSTAVWFIASADDLELGVYAAVQWTAMALGALAVIRYVRHLPEAGRIVLMAAAGFATVGAFITILSGNTLHQIFSLVIFAGLLAVGMTLGERIFTVWGAAGVATAVLWYLRGFTYLLLAFLALALIAFAIWRLARKKPGSSSSSTPVPPSPGPAPHAVVPPGAWPPAGPGEGVQQPSVPGPPPLVSGPPSNIPAGETHSVGTAGPSEE